MPSSIDAPEQTNQLTEVTNTALLDQTVDEVFGLMLGSPVTVSDHEVAPTNVPITLTAVIGLAGALSGGYTLVVSETTAKQLASTMLGIEITELSSDVYDALGEITNILAGAWKSKIPSLHAACLLSVPTVVTGSHYDIHRKNTAFRMARSYWFHDAPLTINIYGEWPS
ncbi:chemotaxis protein CheX [Edaphobacter flagellatus]|uniref:chemotaxis protein CheX n=1 Tax=Edaphobacter flagellatus TaxID=1933044 RepID=UPI0021B32B1B|nr:chemotaxis protein CheX [Edaphobacter flagellatus]